MTGASAPERQHQQRHLGTAPLWAIEGAPKRTQRHGAAPDADTANSLVLLPAPQSLEETERLVAEGQGLPPPEIPLSTLPDHHLGDGLLGGLLDEVRADHDQPDAPCCLSPCLNAWDVFLQGFWK